MAHIFGYLGYVGSFLRQRCISCFLGSLCHLGPRELASLLHESLVRLARAGEQQVAFPMSPTQDHLGLGERRGLTQTPSLIP